MLLRENKAFFFDRDGILNRSIIKKQKPYSPRFPYELKLNHELLPFIKELKKKNFIIIVVTNQPDVKRGKLTKYSLKIINLVIKKYFLVDEIYTCMHDKIDNCDCRKPKPGMLKKAMKKWNINLKKSFLVGDRNKDIQAGNSAGCTTIFIDYNYNELKPENYDYKFTSISKMKKIIKNII